MGRGLQEGRGETEWREDREGKWRLRKKRKEGNGRKEEVGERGKKKGEMQERNNCRWGRGGGGGGWGEKQRKYCALYKDGTRRSIREF
jgi:hypothetical protein